MGFNRGNKTSYNFLRKPTRRGDLKQSIWVIPLPKQDVKILSGSYISKCLYSTHVFVIGIQFLGKDIFNKTNMSPQICYTLVLLYHEMYEEFGQCWNVETTFTLGCHAMCIRLDWCSWLPTDLCDQATLVQVTRWWSPTQAIVDYIFIT